MLYSRHLYISLFVCVASMAGALAQQPTNKPTATSQVPAPTHTVADVPVGYVTNPMVNYVRTWEPRKKMSDANAVMTAGYTDVKEGTQYLDGLGRPLQTVVRQASPGSTPKDMVMPVVYDEYGREMQKYLPYLQITGSNASNGKFKIDPFTDQTNFYQNVYPAEQPAYTNEQVYYSQVQFETSPLSRPTKSMSPGNSWAGHNIGVEQKYLFNTAAEDVRIWSITNNALTYTNNDITTNIPVTSTMPYGTGQYQNGELYKSVTIDETGNAVVEYKDKEGKVILKKVQIAPVAAPYNGYEAFLCTYYVYDDFGQLRFVIPPKAVTYLLQHSWDLSQDPALINELCFRYEYDHRNRMIAKKVPGAAWVYMVYDSRDRMVFSQDAHLRARGHWMGYMYDALNRQVMTGFVDIYPLQNNRDVLQASVDAQDTEGAGNSIVVREPPPDHLYVSVRNNSDVQVYKAIKSVTFSDEFTSEDLAEFTTSFILYYDFYDRPVNVHGGALNYQLHPWDNISDLNVEPLTVTHYDNYNWAMQGFTDRYNSKLKPRANLYPETMPTIAEHKLIGTRGMMTGTEVRVMPPNDDEIRSNYSQRTLYSIPFYDEEGRVIQMQSNNTGSGTDIQTNLYDFSGKILSSHQIHTNLGASMINLQVRSDYDYDAGGRLINVFKTINENEAQTALIAHNEYDGLGQLKEKYLGQKRNSNGSYSTEPLQKLKYDYNIRGWLKGINKEYATGASGTPDRLFGMELSYDYGFDHNQVNGNIAGMKWRSGGDDEQRAYGFGYDAANRLLYGDFNQRFGSLWDKQDPNSAFKIDFSTWMGDGIDPSSAYDQNGNILAMKQWGLKLNTSEVIDNLGYTYKLNGSGNTNKLLNVIDEKGAEATKLGDFHYSTAYAAVLNGPKPNTAEDYAYDDNGRLLKDQNKDLYIDPVYTGSGSGVMGYNHLNLPVRIKFAGSQKMILYTYDATGRKLAKWVEEPGVGNHYTDYVGPFVYQDNVLQFMSHEEGRIRYKPAEGATPASFVYDYFIKDHLGNVRMVLTDEMAENAYPAATMETDQASIQEQLYSQLATTRSELPTGYPDVDNADGSDDHKVAKVNGSGNKVGPGIILKVMAGDKFNVAVTSWYKTNSVPLGSPSTAPLDELLGALVTGIGNLPNSHATASQLGTGTIFSPGIEDFFDERSNDHTSGGRPKAYLNWVLLDEQFRFVSASSGAEQVSPEADYHNPNNPNVVRHIKTDMLITQNGYLYLFVSNETTNLDVFFDNLQVKHIRGRLLEETHYYPFGLTVAGISSKALKGSYAENKKGFNGNEIQQKEFTDGSGLELYDFSARTYDQQIGRFLQIDPLANEDHQQHLTPYHFALNNPVCYNDPDGKCALCKVVKAGFDYTVGRIQGALTVAAGGLKQQYEMAKFTYNLATNPQMQQQVVKGIQIIKNDPKASAKALGQHVVKQVSNAVKSATDPKNITPANVGKFVGAVEGTVTMAMAGGGAIPKAPSTPAEMITLFRGVNESHPGFANASEGVAIPRGGSATAAEHNLGNTQSAFTSWTTNPEVATNYALRPDGSGLVLEITVPRSSTFSSPSVKNVVLKQSGQYVNESEVLMQGTVTGAKIRTIQ
jgi:RHS repeat-associated protein